MTQLIVVTGPIASGKSTIARALAMQLRDAGHAAATVDLDDVVETLHAPPDAFERLWERARDVHGELVGAWLRSGIDEVIAHGPFYTLEEVAPLLAHVPIGIVPRFVLLDIAYDVALERVTVDQTRRLSRDPVFLRQTHDRFRALSEGLHAHEWTFDTATTSVEVIATTIAAAILQKTQRTRALLVAKRRQEE